MTAKAILEELKPLGRDSYKKVLLNHGVNEELRVAMDPVLGDS